MDGRGLVGGQDVHGQVDVVAGREGLVDRDQELAELDGPVLRVQLSDHLAGGGTGDLQGGEQVQGAGPDVLIEPRGT